MPTKADLEPCQLYLLFTPSLCRADPWQTLRKALGSGCIDLVQWRQKDHDADEHQNVERCAAICRAFGVPLVINDNVALAAKLNAAGSHIGQDDMTPADARRLLGPSRWLGISTHSDQEIDAAIAAGADYIGFGPIFPTATKGYREGQPAAALDRALARSTVPVFAIGGITARRLVGLRAPRIAVSSAILDAGDPEAAALELGRALRRRR